MAGSICRKLQEASGDIWSIRRPLKGTGTATCGTADVNAVPVPVFAPARPQAGAESVGELQSSPRRGNSTRLQGCLSIAPQGYSKCCGVLFRSVPPCAYYILLRGLFASCRITAFLAFSHAKKHCINFAKHTMKCNEAKRSREQDFRSKKVMT